RKYHLHAWVVMPNHVHLLISPKSDSTLAAIAHSLKSCTAKEANGLPGRTGSFWQRENFDRAIRDVEHYRTEIEYIEANPIKAGLCVRIGDWPFSSARLRKIG
ncbi:MAG: transposase, partial [Candidatus Sericytochromatia bacterium]|nr:transposase [Candidatus Tanganyikabacteria bacterium]